MTMASVSTDKNGNRKIQFVAKDRKRKTVYLGPVPLSTARNICHRVECLNVADMHGDPLDHGTAEWLATKCDGILRDKLAAVGLCARRERAALGAFLTAYTQKRTDVKPATLINWGHTVRCLLAYFGAERPLASITAGEAADWQRWLLTGAARENRYGETEADEGLSKNTARKRVSNAKQFFADAVARDLIRKNPFDGLSGSVAGNRDRDYFVTRDQAQQVLEACPDAQWRLIFALSRFGGLRCPSEHLALTWADVDLPGGKLTIHSTKTEHHAGGGVRVIPIFPECAPTWRIAMPCCRKGPRAVSMSLHAIAT